MPKNGKSEIPSKTQALVIGGGPAGSLCATFLAREGWDVVLLEREQHPRYHIGESLLPSIVPILEFAGAYEKIAKHGFVKKPGGLFKLLKDVPAGIIDFKKVTDYTHSFQVIRSEFDQLLFEHARECGARAIDQVKVTEVLFTGERPTGAKWTAHDGREGQIEFDQLIDATGLSSLLSTRYFKNRVIQESFKNLAIGRYWKNARPIREARKELESYGPEWDGAAFIESLTDGTGWVWGIPLHDGTLSVGIVMHKDVFDARRGKFASHEEMYHDQLKLCPETMALIGEGETVGKAHVWQDYSYAASQFAGVGYRMIGDAAGFIDPLFSTGVHMAGVGALSAAASLCGMRKDGVDEARSWSFHNKLVRRSYSRFIVTVAAMYQQVWNQGEIVLPGITPQSWQSAFDMIQPIVSGGIDIGDEVVQNGTMQETMDFLYQAVMGQFKFQKASFPALMSGKKMWKMEVDGIDAAEPIDGLFIRTKHGSLGLEQVGVARATVNKATGAVLRSVFKLLKPRQPATPTSSSDR
jgi:flavin-dependent dehydrogenase